MRTQDFGRLPSIAALLLSTLTSSFAATPADDDIVTVTGSRIQRTDTSANSPTVSIDEKDIARLGALDAEELIRELPQAAAGISSSYNTANPGVATVNLRNIGAERSLVLIDGKRLMPFDAFGEADLNNIPLPLVTRVDVVTGGASAVYGSDAMAGVINFILREDFEGLQLNANVRRTAESDGDTKHLSLTAGGNFADGRGNGTVYLGYTDRDPVYGKDRDISRIPYATASNTPAGSFTDTNGLIVCFPTPPCGGEFLVSFAPNGNLLPYDGRTFNYNDYILLQIPQNRFQGAALVHYDVNDKVRSYGRFNFSQTRIDTINAPSGSLFFETFEIPLDSPFLNNQARRLLADRLNNVTLAPGGDNRIDPAYDANNDNVVDAGTSVTESFARRTVETGPRIVKNRSMAYQALAGLKGDLWSDWNWDVSFQHGRTEITRLYTNDVSRERMQASMAGCPPGSPAGCVAGNFFGDGNLSPAAANYIRLQVNDAVYSEQQIAQLSFSGKLGEFAVPGASPIGAAFGAEYRKEMSESFPDDCFTTPGCSGGYGNTLAVRNEYSVKEIFGELLVPVLEERRFAQRLNLEAGLRLSDYSTVDRTHALKFGGDWAPLSPSLRLRAMYQKAVRAPNIFEFGSPRQQNLGPASGDPCSGNITGALRDLCVATGVPVSAVGSVQNVINGQLNVFQGGNPNLEEEDSDTVTVGFVWTGTEALEGLSTQVDWYSIEIDNAISTLDADTVLSACYSAVLNPSRNPSSPACALVLRNPLTGGLVGDRNYGVSQASENIARIKVSGVDVNLGYRLATQSLGAFQFSLLGTYELENSFQPLEELPVRECQGLFGTSCNGPNPRLRFNQGTVWTIGEFDIGYRLRFLQGTETDHPNTTAAALEKISSRQYLDLQFGWRPARFAGLSVRAGVDNALNKEPPFVGEDAGPLTLNMGNTYPGTFDVLGRSFFVSATHEF